MADRYGTTTTIVVTYCYYDIHIINVIVVVCMCRIKEMRQEFRTKLEASLAAQGRSDSNSWQHVTEQIGMFCYTGLTPAQVSNKLPR